jgi:hypothetical protein
MFYFHHKRALLEGRHYFKMVRDDRLDVNNRTPSFLDCY